MTITRTQKIAYGFLLHGVVLLVLYVVGSLLTAIKFLGDDPLAISLPYHHITALTGVLLQLAVLSLLIGGGIYAIAHERADNQFQRIGLLNLVYRLWTVLCILAFAAGFLNLLEGRAGHELPISLDLLLIAILILLVFAAAASLPKWSPIPSVWLVGLLVVIVAVALSLFMDDFKIGAISLALREYIGFGLLSVSVMFWLAHRFSNITLTWAGMGAYSVGGFVTIAGMFLMLPTLYTLDAPDYVTSIGAWGVIAIPICCAIFASHLYRALSDRNQAATLAPQWVALSLILFLLGAGFLGAINALPGVHAYIAGTRLADLQRTLILLSYVAVGLGAANQVASELRGLQAGRENRRVTGFVPFWLVAFGAIIAAIALAAAGIVQVYLERLLSIGYLETQTLIIPLYTVWVIGLVSVALGVAIYAFAFWARRIRG
jgi:nitric oxide reductase subunit B